MRQSMLDWVACSSPIWSKPGSLATQTVWKVWRQPMNPKITEQHRSRPAYIYVRHLGIRRLAHRTTPEQTRLHLCAPVDECPSAPPPGEHGAPVCTAHDGAGVGLERIGDSHARPGPGHDGDRDDKREDFKTLVADVSMGQVGAVFALEVSRLARSNLDWHRCWSCARSPRRW